MPNPKVLLFNFKTGSGVETFGDTITYMFEGVENFSAYKIQTSASVIYEELMITKPDVILLNELYRRTMEASYYYKLSFPDTKIIFFNHCFPNLKVVGNNDKFPSEDFDPDVTKLIKTNIFRNCDHIFNLNYRSPTEKYPENIKDKVIEMIFPMEDRFKTTIPWDQRNKPFFFFGSVCQVKFSPEFVQKIQNTKMHIDLYGRTLSEERYQVLGDKDYLKKVLTCPNLKHHGWIPESDLPNKLNEYKFYVVPHLKREPFMLTIAEAIRCGCIPLVVNDRKIPGADWLDWAKGCYVEYQSVDELIERMQNFIDHRTSETIRTLTNTSKEISLEMTKRTDHKAFKDKLFSLIYKK